jgi:hypothetical protein
LGKKRQWRLQMFILVATVVISTTALARGEAAAITDDGPPIADRL